MDAAFDDSGEVGISYSLFKSNTERLRIRVFAGGEMQNQDGHFKEAVGECIKKYSLEADFEFLYIGKMRDNAAMWKNSPSLLVDWLLESDAHFIICQGVHMQLMQTFNWNAVDIYKQIDRLWSHPGIPNGQNLRCPIWSQDKWGYLGPMNGISSLDKDYICCTPSVRVDFDELPLTNEKIKELQFLIDNFEEFKMENGALTLNGLLIKCPFQTHGHERRQLCSPGNVETLSERLHQMKGIVGDAIHYCIIQPKMANKYEAKIVVGPDFTFRAHSTQQRGDDKTIGKQPILEAFAKAAHQRLCEKVPHAITDCIIRVDIFQSADGRFQVNEFESYDALVSAGGRGTTIRARNDGLTNQHMINYWIEKIRLICCKMF